MEVGAKLSQNEEKKHANNGVGKTLEHWQNKTNHIYYAKKKENKKSKIDYKNCEKK